MRRAARNDGRGAARRALRAARCCCCEWAAVFVRRLDNRCAAARRHSVTRRPFNNQTLPSFPSCLVSASFIQDDLPSDVKIVFVLGGPGSGKGTQCAKVVEQYGFKHLSAGDLLRDEVKSGSAVGKQCEAIMKEGKLVPMEVIIGLLRAAMVKSGAKEFLIDGFPRAMDQAVRFEEMIKPCE